MTECAAGCGTKAFSVMLSDELNPLPPTGWYTVGIDVSLPEPPYQIRNENFSAVCCSLDCVITFLSRKKRVMELSKVPIVTERSWDYTEETRSDVAKRIGFSVLEAVGDLEDDGRMVMLPLEPERDRLNRDVCLVLLPGIPELESVPQSSD